MSQLVYYSVPIQEHSIAITLSVCASVCVSICLQAYLCNRWTNLYKICVQIPCGRDLVLL